MSFSRFRALLSNNPKATNVVVYGILYGGGELSQQTFQGVEKYNWASVGRIAAIGSFLGPIYSVWYTKLDKFFPGNATKTVVKKLVLDQGLGGLFGVSVFFGGTAALEGKSIEAIKEDVKEKAPKAYMVGWAYWPVVQMINFKFLPTSMRAPYVAAGGFVWTNVLCFIKSFSGEKKIESAENTLTVIDPRSD